MFICIYFTTIMKQVIHLIHVILVGTLVLACVVLWLYGWIHIDCYFCNPMNSEYRHNYGHQDFFSFLPYKHIKQYRTLRFLQFSTVQTHKAIPYIEISSVFYRTNT